MTELVLCCFPGACSRATMIALEECGARYVTRVVNIRSGGQREADYLALNPKGKVPTLLVDARPLTENIAILEYLANTHPQASLLPPTSAAFERAQALSAVAWLSSTVLPAGGRIFRPERICDIESAGSRVASMAADEFRANLAIAERHMTDRTWWLHSWSVADAYLFYIMGLAKARGIESSTYTALLAHTARMTDRPATQRVLAWEGEAMSRLQAA